MNIAMLTNTYPPHVGGVARSVESTAGWLRAQGHRVLIAAPTFPGTPDAEPDVIRIPAIQNFNGSDFSVPLPVTASLHRNLAGFRPRLVHSHHPFLLGDTALRVSAAFDCPIVFTHHTMYEHYTQYVPFDSPRMQRLAIELATEYASLCDAVIAPSDTIAAILRTRPVRSRIEIIPTGVDLTRFEAGDGLALRRALGIPFDASVLGHVGRLADEKNLEFLTSALVEHLSAHADHHVLIVGTGPAESSIRSRFDAHGFADRVHLPGVLEGSVLADAYHAMDVFAFSSKTETQGLVLTEAMAAHVPVVALDAPGVREVVQDRINGRLLGEEDVSAFASALAWTIVESRRRDLPNAAARTAKSYSVDSTGQALIALYEELADRDRQPGDRSQTAWQVARRRLREEWILLLHRSQTLQHAWPEPRARP